MNIAQTIPCLGKNSGGPSRSVYNLAKGLRQEGISTTIITNNYAWNPNLAEENWIKALPCSKPRWREYNPLYRDYLRETIKNYTYSLYHIHSIYSYPSEIASYLCRHFHVPYIISPRGSLYESAMSVSSLWLKKTYNKLILINNFNHANAIHVTCKEEMEAVRQLGITSPIAVIPNALSLQNDKPTIFSPDKLRICFLGRISTKKNIHGLIQAWQLSGLSECNESELLIIGPAQTDSDKKYQQSLLSLQKDLKIRNIQWTGAKNGPERDDLLQTCSYLVLPSFSENFGMVVPEALKLGVPVVASKGTPWQILEEKGCGWWIDIDVASLAKSLRNLKNITEEERRNMGMRGQQLVWESFSMETISKQLISLYKWILEGCEKPEYVYLK